MTTWRPLRPSRSEVDPRPVGDSLGSLARRLGAPDPGVAGAVFARWEEAVGPAVAAHAQPRSLRDGVLVVEVDQPAWATQLRMLAGDLLGRLNASAGPGADVNEIRLQVRPRGRPRPSEGGQNPV